MTASNNGVDRSDADHAPEVDQLARAFAAPPAEADPGWSAVVLGDGGLIWDAEMPADVLSFVREPGFRCIVNFGPEPHELPAGVEIVLASADLTSRSVGTDEAVWLRF